jgi:hypothetical protein
MADRVLISYQRDSNKMANLFDFTPPPEQEFVCTLSGLTGSATLSEKYSILSVSLARKGSPDRVVILTSVAGQFSRNLAVPGAPVVVHINGVRPRWSWVFGSALFFKRSSSRHGKTFRTRHVPAYPVRSRRLNYHELLHLPRIHHQTSASARKKVVRPKKQLPTYRGTVHL